MNERIRQLAEEAGIGFWGDSIIVMNPDTWGEEAVNKFAELIVLECEKVSLKSSLRDDDMGAIIARQIKRHFGVEE